MPTEIKAQNTTTLASVKAIYDAADEANTLLDGMQAAATAAGTTLNGIYQDAADAQTAADTAQQAADTALVNLATTENVVGVLNWITAHGTMTLTSDVTVNPAHVYFVVNPTGDYVVGGTHYSVVAEPTDDDIATYYELSVDESVQNYVATHIVVDTEGLWIVPDSGGNKVLIATGAGSTYTTAGTYIVGTGNVVLASFTASGAQIGKNDGGNVSIDNNSVDINDGASQLATFGADGAQIGKDDENRLIITPIELLQKNSDGAVFFNVNTNNGTKTISVTLSGDSGSQNTTIASSGSYSKTSEISIPSDLSPGTTVELSAMTGKLKPQYTGSEMVGWSFTFQNSTFNSTYREPSDAFINSNTLACFDVPSSSISVGTDLTNSYSCDFTVKYSGSTTIGLYHVSCVVSYSSANNKITSTWTVENNFSEARTISFKWSSLQGVFSYSTTVPYYVLGTSADAAVGAFSIVGGQGIYATSDNQSAFGKFNVQDSNNDYAFMIGNGSDSANRSNALTVDWSGNVEAAGGGVFGDDVITKKSSGETWCQAVRSDTGTTVSVGIGSGGDNHGLFSNTNTSWIIYDDASGVVRIPAADIRLQNHSSKIGTVKRAYLTSATSVSSGGGNAKSLCNLSLEAGTWLIVYGARFPTNTTGNRVVNMSTTQNDSSAMQVVAPASGNVTQTRASLVVQPTATTKYYLSVYHTAGTALSMPASGNDYGNFMTAWRLI